LRLPLSSEFEVALKKCNSVLNYLKTQLQIIVAFYHVAQLIIMLPFGLAKPFMNWISDGGSLFYTNVLFSKSSFVWNGKKTLGIFNYCPLMAHNQNSIAICTIDQYVGVTCFTDEYSEIKDP